MHIPPFTRHDDKSEGSNNGLDIVKREAELIFKFFVRFVGAMKSSYFDDDKFA